MLLSWDFDGDGTWEAFSAIQDDGCSFVWRIGVCDDGTFAVSESDTELTDRKETFDTFNEAKAFCEAGEVAFVESQKAAT